MTKLTLSFLLFLGLLSTSCKDLTGENTGANEVEKSNKVIGGQDAVSLGDKKFLLSGTADTGGNSGHNFHLRFKLPEGESLEFHFFSSKDLTGGADFLFSRKSGKVNLKISLNDKVHNYELKAFDSLDIVDLDIDIHNDHTDIHMLIWEHSGTHDDNEECTFDGGCLYNTEDFAFDIWLGVGKARGAYWGLSGDSELILTLDGPLEALSNV